MSFFSDIPAIQNIVYIFSSILFISGIKMLGKEDTAVRGNFLSASAMFIAVAVTIINVVNPVIVLIGVSIGAVIGSLIALRVKMTSIPEMVLCLMVLEDWQHFLSLGQNLMQFLITFFSSLSLC